MQMIFWGIWSHLTGDHNLFYEEKLLSEQTKSLKMPFSPFILRFIWQWLTTYSFIDLCAYIRLLCFNIQWTLLVPQHFHKENACLEECMTRLQSHMRYTVA